SRLEIQKIDLQFLTELGEAEVPFAIIYTKCDKQGTFSLNERVENNNKILLEYWEELPPVFLTSAETGKGREEILDYIGSIIDKKTIQ
ncbi:MAG: YihA family ribosome biogenesis GTP-binding protein, partial [Bacteroidales bacterium]|nr:YihA family ribosome biogenesis GTP-binding protein [Bacteroidales bacterium]